MYKSILVAVDISDKEIAKILVSAAKQISGNESKIVVTNIVEDIPVYVAAEIPGGFIDKAKAEVREILEEISRDVGVEVVVDVRSGPAHREILTIAEERNTDLIILASHSPRIEDWLLGSTAARVVRHAKCSVLIER